MIAKNEESKLKVNFSSIWGFGRYVKKYLKRIQIYEESKTPHR